MTRLLSRRVLLLGGAVGTVGACGYRLLDDDSVPDGVVTGSFRSARLGQRSVGYAVACPAGHSLRDGLPVVVSLHGRGQDHAAAFQTLRLDRTLDDVVGDGVPPFAFASVDGGDHGYWHRRADATDAGAMVVEEFVPLLAEQGLDTTRLGLHGWSMGGYGALLLAGRRRLPVRALAVASPALFSAAGNTPPGAFDDAADFLRNDVYGRPELLDGLPLRVDCGRSDPFYAATRRFVADVDPRPVTSFGAGGHDAAYWRHVAPRQLTFLGHHLAG
jgi:enterochelin esterase-like enzyme